MNALESVAALMEENRRLKHIVAAQSAMLHSYGFVGPLPSEGEPTRLDKLLPNSSQGYIHPRLRARA